MNSSASGLAVLALLAAIVQPSAHGQQNTAGTEKSGNYPAYVYRNFGKITEQSTEYQNEGWALCGSYLDASGSPQGIYRRQYAKFNSHDKSLQNLQGTWKLTRLREYNVLKYDQNDPALHAMTITLQFTNNEFVFTQTGPGDAQHMQGGTVQYVGSKPGSPRLYAVDMLIQQETTRGKRTPSQTKPYTTVRVLVRRQGNNLEILSGASTDDRPQKIDLTAEPKAPAYSKYELNSK